MRLSLNSNKKPKHSSPRLPIKYKHRGFNRQWSELRICENRDNNQRHFLDYLQVSREGARSKFLLEIILTECELLQFCHSV